jgi:glycosyl transferase family 1
MRGAPPVDVLIVSLAATAGLRAADDELQDALLRAGATVAIARALAPAETRTLMLTDFAWARAARMAARKMLRQLERSPPRSVLYSSTTAALFWPRPGAIRFDATAVGNRPGRHGLWQRPLERRRLRQAPLLLPWSEGALREASLGEPARARTFVLPVPIAPSGQFPAERDIAAITYAANPSKKGLDRVLGAWRELRADGRLDEADELFVVGVPAGELERAGYVDRSERDVRVLGSLSSREYRGLLRRARVFICAPRREDFGIAQLEALADGCLLVSTPAPGPYVALSIARRLDPRLISEDLAGALRVALEDPVPDYAERAVAALVPFAPDALDELVAEELLPRLLRGPLR